MSVPGGIACFRCRVAAPDESIARRDRTYNGDYKTYCCEACQGEMGELPIPPGGRTPAFTGERVEQGWAAVRDLIKGGEDLVSAIREGAEATRNEQTRGETMRIAALRGHLSHYVRMVIKLTTGNQLITDWENPDRTPLDRLAIIAQAEIPSRF